MRISVLVVLVDRKDILIHPERTNSWETNHFDQEWYQRNKPELKLEMSPWHEQNAAEVPNQNYFDCLAALFVTFETCKLNCFNIWVHLKERHQIIETAYQCILTDEEMVNV